MGLFDGGIPAGVQMMLANMVKQAAPQIVEQIDQFAQIVRDCKVQLDRIEAKFDAMENGNGQRSSERQFDNDGTGRALVHGVGNEEIERPLNDT